ncbi:chemotaxis protein CheA [Pseudoalteromonas sp. L23]|uniref:chemotaxis protein CheA n=1 Tax=unclassified Pseudoalteromonas TaxID=194690 RepID=UPI001EF0EAAA|nr:MULTISPECIES: chemotaxis protein CheA [unclassified Pseudoalteromonas]MCF7513014.1 chemotaxis protein CheA [Pseudoalteromonas sp. L7]MCF7525054.1 chemotaxis protein CheA [Pseudoalteromonas sp. L23]MCX2765480.1 chemotaxis protein CheA [Pseudoalteromonas sp. B530]
MVDLSEIQAVFIEEAKELVLQFEESLLAMESILPNSDDEIINEAFRAAHTIKGSAGVVGYDHIVDFTHFVEATMELLRDHALNPCEKLISTLLECNDHINALIKCLESNEDFPQALTDAETGLLESLKSYSGLQDQVSSEQTVVENQEATQSFRVSAQFYKACMVDGFDPLSIIRYIESKGSTVEVDWLIDEVPALNAVTPDELELCYFRMQLEIHHSTREDIDEAFEFIAAESNIEIAPIEDDKPTPTLVKTDKQPTKNNKVKPKNPERMMKIPAQKLDELVNELGELVIVSAALEDHTKTIRDSALTEIVEHIQQLVSDVQSSTLQLRMVQIGETFNRFSRVVRDTSKELEKQVSLEIMGAETELDKSMVEKIVDPLTHLVRNAIDHGMESPAQRADSGKPEYGTLSLKAFHDSGSIVIEISDDGRGLDKEKIKEKAIQRNLISPDTELTDKEIANLIFEPGFSTAEKISNISGRGVGMDVVRKNIEAVRGTVSVESVEHQGTCFQLRLPLTMAIIDGFMVSVADAKFVIPLDMVTECIELPLGNGATRQTDYINLRGTVLPFIHLSRIFDLPTNPKIRPSIVVVKYGQLRAGIVVDQLLGEFQTVIKPLGALFEKMSGISGSSILGSGDIALILDVPKLIHDFAHEPESRKLANS